MIRLFGIGVGGLMISAAAMLDWGVSAVTFVGFALVYFFGLRK